MNFIEASILILFIAIISVPISIRFRMPLEIFLFLGSCLISLIPGLPEVKIDPLIVFELFLPPILFSAAYFTSWKDFKFNFRPILLLAFGLVTVTMVVVAIVAKYCIPGFSWSEAFLLGAIVSPTDASAATAIIKKLNAPKRIIAVLEGESLINDATALLLYRFCLATILYGSFSIQQAAMQFGLISLGGVLVGLSVAVIGEYIFKRMKDHLAETALTFVTAFSSYLIAEHCGFSGVISTVVAGIYFGIHFPEIASSKTKMNTKAAWSTLIFIINGFVFTLIGFQLPVVVKNLKSYPMLDLITYGMIISIVVTLVRLLWMYPAAYIPRLLIPSIKLKDPMPPWQLLFTLGWTGMRGIVSLAAVLAIPTMTAAHISGVNLDLLKFITYFVIAFTLIIPTLTLPRLIRFFKLFDERDRLREEALARVRAFEEVIKELADFAKKKKIPESIFQEFMNQINRQYQVVKTQLSSNPYSLLSEEFLAFKKLTLAAIKIEREVLIKLRKSEEINDDVFRSLSDELDLEELRAKSLRI